MDYIVAMPHSLLLIEDEAAIADNVRYALEQEGFEVHWSRLGQDGLRVVRVRDIELILLDVGLPDVNGFELCKEIRSFSEVPIIFLTARSEEVDRDRMASGLVSRAVGDPREISGLEEVRQGSERLFSRGHAISSRHLESTRWFKVWRSM